MIDNSLKSDIKRSSKISGLNDHLYFIFLKELSLCQKSNILITKFLQPNVADLRYFKLWIPSKSLSLKYQRFTPEDCRDAGIRKFEFVATTQFLCFILPASNLLKT